jgi:hypothetical protein
MKAPVQLTKAQLIPSCKSAGWYTGMVAEIEIENLAFEKQVVVHLADGQEEPAHYVRSLSTDREVWCWTSSYQPGTTPNYQFSIRYVVKGESFWDRNGGSGYRLDSHNTSIAAQ